MGVITEHGDNHSLCVWMVCTFSLCPTSGGITGQLIKMM